MEAHTAISDRGGKKAERVERGVIRFAGDSGDGMQLTGSQFTATSALFGNLGGLLNGLRAFVEARMRGEAPEPPTFVLDDGLAEQLDVVGWNQYLGWYYSAILARANGWTERDVREIVLEGMPAFRVEVPSGKPLLVSEFGAGAKQGRRGGALDLWSERHLDFEGERRRSDTSGH